ncbi:hypothetical protein [Microbulbifer sp. YPW16]|uniref:hypothetical protein n=1 Tax=Microbulbifer sp. YPW16 TaxID=2904242 RepID=UPI001E29D075|nr:hypothetical protein [Microbulbifer sp. YPW16]UHQ56876.1 hypothetical protein LVE68_07845 [Microbulbifer sp. YPW16]
MVNNEIDEENKRRKERIDLESVLSQEITVRSWGVLSRVLNAIASREISDASVYFLEGDYQLGVERLEKGFAYRKSAVACNLCFHLEKRSLLSNKSSISDVNRLCQLIHLSVIFRDKVLARLILGLLKVVENEDFSDAQFFDFSYKRYSECVGSLFVLGTSSSLLAGTKYAEVMNYCFEKDFASALNLALDYHMDISLGLDECLNDHNQYASGRWLFDAGFNTADTMPIPFEVISLLRVYPSGNSVLADLRHPLMSEASIFIVGHEFRPDFEDEFLNKVKGVIPRSSIGDLHSDVLKLAK